MKRLEFNEKVCDEPIAVSEEVFNKYMSDGCDDILTNGIVTHIISNKDITSFDTDKIKRAVQDTFDHIRLDFEGFTDVRVAADPHLLVEVHKDGSDFVFNSIVVRPSIS